MAQYKLHTNCRCTSSESNDYRVLNRHEKQYTVDLAENRTSFFNTAESLSNASSSVASCFEETDLDCDLESVPSPDILTKLSCLARQLESQYRCPIVGVDGVVAKIADILQTAGTAIDVSALENDRARKALYTSQGIYVPPEEVKLPHGEKAYFVPLKRLIENLLRHPIFSRHFQSPLQTSNSALLKDFTDGMRVQMHPVASTQEKNTIVMLLYCDDIELANPLGMKRGRRGKLTVFYVSFVNLPPSERSKLANIFLLGVGQAKALKSLEAKHMLLQDFIATLNLLHRGCTLKTVCGEKLFFGFLLAYIGDALACHNIAGFKESFSKNVRLACRTCTVPTSEFHNFHYEIQCPLRTESQYEENLRAIEAASSKKDRTELSAQCGIKSKSVLAEIPNFSILTDLLYDPMHILLEGVIPLELTLFSKFIVREAAWMTLSQLNTALSRFCFHRQVSKSDYPRSFESDFSFPFAASSSLILHLHFLFIIDEYLPEEATEEPHCECFVLLCIITQLFLSPAISPDALGDIECLVARHNELFVQLYGSSSFKPKLHMLVHMVTQIRRFGPSHHHWTMRFESKNALPKSKKFWNFKNIPLSVANYFQMKMSSDLWLGPGQPKLSFAQCDTAPAAGVPVSLTSDFLPCGLQPNAVGQTVMSVRSAFISGVKISISDVVVFEQNDHAMFGEIETIVPWQGKIFIAVLVLVKVSYSKRLNAFILLKTPHAIVIKPDDLLYPWPLYTYAKN